MHGKDNKNVTGFTLTTQWCRVLRLIRADFLPREKRNPRRKITTRLICCPLIAGRPTPSCASFLSLFSGVAASEGPGKGVRLNYYTFSAAVQQTVPWLVHRPSIHPPPVNDIIIVLFSIKFRLINIDTQRYFLRKSLSRNPHIVTTRACCRPPPPFYTVTFPPGKPSANVTLLTLRSRGGGVISLE